MNTQIRKHLSEISEGMTLLDLDEIQAAVSVLRLVRDNLHGTAYIFGNGGSHATASHFANDLMKMCRLRAVCIGDMTPSVLAYGNDNGWENMFRDPLSKLVNPAGDVAIGISCSGSSVNVVNAFTFARQHEMLRIGLTGSNSFGMMNALELDAIIHTPGITDIRTQEDLHSMICHAIVRELQSGD